MTESFRHTQFLRVLELLAITGYECLGEGRERSSKGWGQGSVLETFRIRIFGLETHLCYFLILALKFQSPCLLIYFTYSSCWGQDMGRVEIWEGFGKVRVVHLGLGWWGGISVDEGVTEGRSR